MIKDRRYYQPFASTILEDEAPRLLEQWGRADRFMTVGYKVREERLGDLVAASHIDGTTRPQFLGEREPEIREAPEGRQEDLRNRCASEHEPEQARHADSDDS